MHDSSYEDHEDDDMAVRDDAAAGQEDDEPQPLQPARPIQRLDEAVVNRIAAGEIIQRPANALKELIENSLDAGATMIQITLKEGGLKSMQIRDNGCGVPARDLPLLCERFATSKLREFEDLTSMATFGFRGEALASISFVSASMSVITKTKEDALAYKAFYAAGSLAPPKPGQSTEPKPCAGVDGTTITAEDLFFNVPQRRRALKSAAEEYNRALDIAGKYALHFGARGVGFVCKKAGSNAADLSTPSSPATQRIDSIRLLHGTVLARELVEMKPVRDDKLRFSVEGWISGANWSAKRTTFLCFINNRLVDCTVLKRSLEALYAALLPKGGHPWIYISLEIDPDRLDVNVHPTKSEVHFLDEEDIVEEICTHAQAALSGANSSRSFQFTQALLPGASVPQSRTSQAAGDGSGARDTSDAPLPMPRAPSAASQNPQYQVRVDSKMRTLDSMFSQTQSQAAQQDLAGQIDDANDVTEAATTDTSLTAAATGNARFQVEQSECTLTSITNLRRAVSKDRHSGLCEILQHHTFVGVADLDRALSLLQHSTKLHLVHHDALIEEASYQLCLRQFGSIAKSKLVPPAPLSQLVRMGIELQGTEEAVEQSGLPLGELVNTIVAHLLSHAEMLSEYFSLDMDANTGELRALPALLPGYDVLPVANVPTFLLRLATEVSWDEEQACFEGFARELAWAHTLSQSLMPLDNGRTATDQQNEANKLRETAEWRIAHVWLPYMSSRRGGFVPSKALVKEGKLIQVASLNELYRIFERC